MYSSFLSHVEAFSLKLSMLLCPSDEASGPLLGRSVSLLYWCEDRPLGPATFYSPESNKSMAYCTSIAPQCHTHTYSFGNTIKLCASWLYPLTCIIPYLHSISFFIFTLNHTISFFVVKGTLSLVSIWIILIPFSQPVEATHSIQYRWCTHTLTCEHTEDSCPIQSVAAVGPVRVQQREEKQRTRWAKELGNIKSECICLGSAHDAMLIRYLYFNNAERDRVWNERSS